MKAEGAHLAALAGILRYLGRTKTSFDENELKI